MRREGLCEEKGEDDWFEEKLWLLWEVGWMRLVVAAHPARRRVLAVCGPTARVTRQLV